MATKLYNDIIFGPIHSRRLGLSLGVNLLPLENKRCTFNCIYCECGWTEKGCSARFNRREDVSRLLAQKLEEMAAAGTPPDVITFAGNGEPTMHPDFEAIIDDVIRTRDQHAPKAKVSVLTNGTMIRKESVRRALMRVDNNIVKLDSAFDETVRQIDEPLGEYSVAETVEYMKLFEGQIEEIRPRQVMIYTVDRDTPAPDLHKVPVDELNRIADRVRALGIDCSVAG